MQCLIANCEQSVKTKKLCGNCYDSWIRKENMDWEEWTEKRAVWLSKPKPFQLSPLTKIDPDKRVITRKGGVKANETHICSQCKKDKFISTPAYHLCSNCSETHQYYGYSCGICEITCDGYNNKLNWNSTYRMLVCSNCKGKIRKYHLNPTKLKEYLDVKTCPLCDVVLKDGRGPNARVIDHDHKCCPRIQAHKGFQQTCGNCLRGVICSNCNLAEGLVPEEAKEWSERLVHWRQQTS